MLSFLLLLFFSLSTKQVVTTYSFILIWMWLKKKMQIKWKQAFSVITSLCIAFFIYQIWWWFPCKLMIMPRTVAQHQAITRKFMTNSPLKSCCRPTVNRKLWKVWALLHKRTSSSLFTKKYLHRMDRLSEIYGDHKEKKQRQSKQYPRNSVLKRNWQLSRSLRGVFL